MPEPTRRPIALVTGGSKGIGLALAGEFARHGHDLILVARDEAALERVASDLRQTTGAAGIHPRVGQVDSLDLSPSVFNAASSFKAENHDVMNNPKVHFVLQDGRNYLLTTQKQYDVITGEPPPELLAR